MDFAVSADHLVKLKKSDKRDKYRDLAKELKKTKNMKVTVIPILLGWFETIGMEIGGLRNKKRSGYHPNNGIV